MGFFGMRNNLGLMAFWKKNTTTKTDASLVERFLEGGNPENISRNQTEEIRVTLEDRRTVVLVRMDNGAARSFDCSALQPSDYKGAARELSTIAYGKTSEAATIERLLKTLRPGQELVILRNTVKLEDATR